MSMVICVWPLLRFGVLISDPCHDWRNGSHHATTHYLEIGTFKGSSFISALFGNAHVHGVCVDDWSFNSRGDFYENLWKLLGDAADRVTLVDGDCFTPGLLDSVVQAPIDVYLYDGDHAHEAHRRALVDFVQYLADVANVVIDDWNHPPVRAATAQALRELEADVVVRWSTEVQYTGDGTHTPWLDASSVFWNGIIVLILERRKQPTQLLEAS